MTRHRTLGIAVFSLVQRGSGVLSEKSAQPERKSGIRTEFLVAKASPTRKVADTLPCSANPKSCSRSTIRETWLA